MTFEKYLNVPIEELQDWARQQDQSDPLRHFRAQFYVPVRQNKPLIYLCGNSLGLQPKAALEAIKTELDTWQNHGVEGWFEGTQPWLFYHKYGQKELANVLGAQPAEVCSMNQLTVNIHLLLTSFYNPTPQKFKILTIAGDFPSDQYALETHLQSRGMLPQNALIEVAARAGERTIRTKDLLAAIAEHQSSLALVFMSGLNYYTGQLFDMPTITQAAHAAGVAVGFDLAHAIGNVPLQLHAWGVDFATWCSYKYLNSGPGGVSGVFVHQNHHHRNLPRLAGWWGYDEARRFEMTKGFVPMQGAAGWQLSTPNILSLAVHRASLAIFEEAGIENLRQKSRQLTAFLELMITRANQRTNKNWIEIMTPQHPDERGSQLSLLVAENGRELFDFLLHNHIVGDWREPNCIRLAPAPLYNTFEEIAEVGRCLELAQFV
ncbi:MAG: kynureninase [Runella slithyformis]|nr:MAG: kynureninase [Runella slithyformis]